ncbi:threonylcarbamoyladenosine tRNA methylthiotransferase MtaB [Spirochaetota bacterium]|nr:threonylcarbamoyladenosine tRNA methylthiotransferase MtaB [Spirochaetota bacterium]
MKFSVYNLGCRVNLAELEKITDDLIRRGYTYETTQSNNPRLHNERDINDAEVEFIEIAIVNTCTVTARADKKSWRMIRLLAETTSLEFLFITGCYSELEPRLAEKLHRYKIKSTIVAQRDKSNLADIIDRTVRTTYGYTYENHRAAYLNKFEAFKQSRAYIGAMVSSQERFYRHNRALIKIQDGCNVFCSYCRIPYARGAPRSRAAADIVNQVIKLAKTGVHELVLAGINLSAYHDKTAKMTFSGLLMRLLAVIEGTKTKIRLSSLEPHGLDEDFFTKVLPHPNMTPHLHLPLQSASAHVLKDMNRRYTLAEYKAIIDRIYAVSPYFAITTDIITGYPGESETDFATGLEFIRACRFFKLHVFPFSYRPLSSLPSATAEQGSSSTVTSSEKKYRADTLRALSRELEQEKLQLYSNLTQSMILETRLDENEVATWLTQYPHILRVLTQLNPSIPTTSENKYHNATAVIGGSSRSTANEFCTVINTANTTNTANNSNTTELAISHQNEQQFNQFNQFNDFYVYTGTSEYYVKGKVVVFKEQLTYNLPASFTSGDLSPDKMLGKAISVRLSERNPLWFVVA